VASDLNRNTQYQQGGTALSLQVKENWQTPQSRDYKNPEGQNQDNLTKQVKKWPTPLVSDLFTEKTKSSQQTEGSSHSVTLPQAVQKNWPTPTANNMTGPGEHGNGGQNLQTEVQKNWPTVRMSDHKGAGKPGDKAQLFLESKSYLSGAVVGQPGKGLNNTNGKNPGQLNPAWVAQLMGTTFERILFVHLVTP
jgi:hypothetical protein